MAVAVVWACGLALGVPPAFGSSDVAVVTGSVFADEAGTGERDPGDRGVPGVTVSDGAAMTQTDDRGFYRLEVDPERRVTDLVFISVPAGWRVDTDEHQTPRFYRHVDLVPGGQASADFALQRDPSSRDTDYRALGLADVHVQAGTVTDRERFSHQIDQLNDLIATAAKGPHPRRNTPRFTVVAGDLTNTATHGEFEDYKAATARSALPVWPAVGNHEYFFQGGPDYKGLIDNYRQHVGPEWYSFSYGNQHFVILENNTEASMTDEDQFAWLLQDLAWNARGREVVVITHKPLNTPQTVNRDRTAEYIQLLETYDTTLLLAGHTHSNDVAPDVIDGAKHAVTNSASYTIDQTPNGFRVLDFTDDDPQPDIPFREFETLEPRVTMVHPAPGARVPREPTEFLVNAYHTSSWVESARFRVGGAGRWRQLQPRGRHTWAAPFDAAGLPEGTHRLTVELTDNGRNRWEEASDFEVVPAGTVETPAQGADWSMFHGDAAHSGVAAQELSPELGLAWAWQSRGTILTSSPAVSDNAAFVGIRDEDGAEHNAVAAVELATGRERWRVATDAQVQASPAVADGVVYAGSVRGTTYALDAQTGDVVWEHAVGRDRVGRAWQYYSPTVADGVVYQAYFPHGESTQLTALDAATGEVRWTTGSLGGGFAAHASPVVGDTYVYFVAPGGRINAIDPADGTVVWSAQPAGGWMRSMPMYADGKVLMNYQGDQLVAVDGETGEILWRYLSPQDSFLYGSGTASVPAVADGVAYVGFADGNITAIDLERGTARWSQRTAGGIISSPVVSGDYLYVGSNDGRVLGLDRETGQPLWSHEIGTWVASSPAVTGNTLVVGAWDGGLYAFAPDGSEPAPRWPQATVTGTVTAHDGAAVAGARVSVTDEEGDSLTEVFTDADGTYEVTIAADLDADAEFAAQLTASRRAFLPDRAEVTLTDGAVEQVDLVLEAVTEPIAGVADWPTDFAHSQPWTRSVVPGDTYHYAMNDRVQATISSRVGANNNPGTFHPGWLSDFALLDDVALETLDWSEYVLTTNGPGEGPDWNRAGEWLPLPDIHVVDDTVVAAGAAEIDESLEASMTYRVLPDAPVIKLTLEVTNTGDEDFDGYFHYNLDPDTAWDVAVVPGLGSNPGHVDEGWTANYVYDGPDTADDVRPAHAIAWLDDEPMTLSAHGYIFGAWFDAATAAGQTTRISWYHITDYPAAGDDITANIAQWAEQLDVLDDEAGVTQR